MKTYTTKRQRFFITSLYYGLCVVYFTLAALVLPSVYYGHVRAAVFMLTGCMLLLSAVVYLSQVVKDIRS